MIQASLLLSLFPLYRLSSHLKSLDWQEKNNGAASAEDFSWVLWTLRGFAKNHCKNQLFAAFLFYSKLCEKSFIELLVLCRKDSFFQGSFRGNALQLQTHEQGGDGSPHPRDSHIFGHVIGYIQFLPPRLCDGELGIVYIFTGLVF